MSTTLIVILSGLGIILLIGFIRVLVSKPNSVGDFFLEVLLLDLLLEIIIAIID